MTDTLVDKLLKEAITANGIKINDYRKQIELFNNQIAILNKENKEYVAEYQKNCLHPEKKKRAVSHMSGGHDHTSQTTYEIRCTRCEKLFESRIERGTYA